MISILGLLASVVRYTVLSPNPRLKLADGSSLTQAPISRRALLAVREVFARLLPVAAIVLSFFALLLLLGL